MNRTLFDDDDAAGPPACAGLHCDGHASSESRYCADCLTDARENRIVVPEVEAEIRGMAALARPTVDQIETILDGWSLLFARLKLYTVKDQMDEFNGVIRAYRHAGSISVVAPRS